MTSASSSLRTTWNSLQDQAITGWEETPSTTAMLAELNPTSSTNVNAGQTRGRDDRGDHSGVQDLQFSFRVSRTPGDYNGNSNVDAADFVIWRETLGSTTDLRANGNNAGHSAGVIDAAGLSELGGRILAMSAAAACRTTAS